MTMRQQVKLNKQQDERVARNIIGYKGPMESFNKFLESDPAKKQQYLMATARVQDRVNLKRMAKGGMVDNIIKMQSGGLATEDQVKNLFTENLARDARAEDVAEYTKFTPEQVKRFIESSSEYGERQKQLERDRLKEIVPGMDLAPEERELAVDEKVTAQTMGTDAVTDVKFTPIEKGSLQIVSDPRTLVTEQAAMVSPMPTATTYTAETTQSDVINKLAELSAQVTSLSEGAKVTAEEKVPTTTKVSDITAEEIASARTVEGAPVRTEQAGEMISGSAVKMADAELEIAKNQAAQSSATPEMTVAGQLDKLLQDFNAGNPPAWASAGMRSATAVLNQRGLGASSLAGQAVVQAIMESAVPIAAQDAQTLANLNIQNLSNRQQIAVLSAQQRAAFLGQQFDQEFQTRTLNAARVADIANQNFNAETQIALENAKLAQTVDLANLNNRQATVMAEAAQIANLETVNLNNRQQAAVENAKSFLQIDMANLGNQQQTALFKTQEIVRSLFTDQAAENAQLQFNATSQNQLDQFFANLQTQTRQFNAQQSNAVEQFNVNAEMAIEQFNAQQENARQQFNASNGVLISQANAEARNKITTIDNATQNAVNQFNATNALGLTKLDYEKEWQTYNDIMQYAWLTGENELNRANEVTKAILEKSATTEASQAATNQALITAVGALIMKSDTAAELGDGFLRLIGLDPQEDTTTTAVSTSTDEDITDKSYGDDFTQPDMAKPELEGTEGLTYGQEREDK